MNRWKCAASVSHRTFFFYTPPLCKNLTIFFFFDIRSPTLGRRHAILDSEYQGVTR
jgi:hypothetical protein